MVLIDIVILPLVCKLVNIPSHLSDEKYMYVSDNEGSLKTNNGRI